MTDAPSQSADVDDLDSGPDDAVASALLNALREVTDQAEGIVEDAHSREAVADAYRVATDDDRRRKFERALEAVADAGGAQDEQAVLRSVVDDVFRRLSDGDLRLRFTHRTSAALDARDVALYSFLRAEDPAALEDLDVSPAVEDEIAAGGDALATGAVGEAREAFLAAVEAAETRDDHVGARVLAAWATHRAGEHEAALPLVTESLERDPEAWPARVVGTIADHESPSLFRDGQLSVRAYLRVRADVPDAAELSAAVRPRDEKAGWQRLSGPLGCLRVPDSAVRSALDVRLRLSGPLDQFPSLYAYYLAVGVVDEANDVPRNVLHQPLQGPETADAAETLRFEP